MMTYDNISMATTIYTPAASNCLTIHEDKPKEAKSPMLAGYTSPNAQSKAKVSEEGRQVDVRTCLDFAWTSGILEGHA
jgi:hypothetical protein